MTDEPHDPISEKQLKEQLFDQFHRFLHDPKAAETAVNAIIEDQNDQWHTFLMESLAGIALPPAQAHALWGTCYRHWKTLCQQLGRNPGIHVAILDCLQNQEGYFVGIKMRVNESGNTPANETEVDELTQLMKKDSFHQRIYRSISRSKRNRLPFTIGLIQIDQFELLKTTRGPLNTSEVLRKTGDLMQQSIRDVDFAFYLGGASFAVVLPETDRMGAFIVAERIRTKAEIDLKAYQTLVSSGLATFPEDGEEHDSLLERATQALGKAQESGGNRVCMDPDERRAYPRLNENLMVRIKEINTSTSRSEEAITRDISGSGFSFEHSTPFKENQPVQGEIELPNRLIQFLGKVIRSLELEEGRYEIAIEFLSIDPESRFHLLSFTR